MACRESASEWGLADACPLCGHGGLVHPGAHNPALTHCLLCEVQDEIDRIREYTWQR